MFSGAKKILKIFWKHYRVRNEKLIIPLLQFFFKFFEPEKVKKPFFIRAKIWVEFECKYMKVGTRHLFSYLWYNSSAFSRRRDGSEVAQLLSHKMYANLQTLD